MKTVLVKYQIFCDITGIYNRSKIIKLKNISLIEEELKKIEKDFTNIIDIKIIEDNPVPSLDNIQIIEDLLEKDGESEFDNDPRDAYFNGVRDGIQTYFKHYYLNGVETNKSKPNNFLENTELDY